MTRINLYNYRQQEIYFAKLRIGMLIGLAIVAALLVNLLIWGYLQLKISHQQARNNFLLTQLNNVNQNLQPLNEYQQRLHQVQEKIQLLQKIATSRDDLVAFFQQIHIIVPDAIYFTSLNLNLTESRQNTLSSVDFSGRALSPLYIADFLSKLRLPTGIFRNPQLTNNATSDGNTYNFTIKAQVLSNPQAKSN